MHAFCFAVWHPPSIYHCLRGLTVLSLPETPYWHEWGYNRRICGRSDGFGGIGQFGKCSGGTAWKKRTFCWTKKASHNCCGACSKSIHSVYGRANLRFLYLSLFWSFSYGWENLWHLQIEWNEGIQYQVFCYQDLPDKIPSHIIPTRFCSSTNISDCSCKSSQTWANFFGNLYTLLQH